MQAQTKYQTKFGHFSTYLLSCLSRLVLM